MLYPTIFIIFCAFLGDVFAQKECISKCPQNCSDSRYQPVCGRTKNGTEKTFDNDCELERFNCQEKGGYTKIYNTSCEDKGCNTSCTYEYYEPVCAQNSTHNVTYPNECILERDNCLYGYNLKKTSNGECSNGTCYEDYYDPLCAYSPGKPRKTFQNLCELNQFNQNNSNGCNAGNYTKIRDGQCELPGLCADCLSSYLPRCACNGTICRTFNDFCELTNTNQCYGTQETRTSPFIELFDGTCDGTGCPDHCYGSFINVPVCAFNGTNYRRFNFECLLVQYNCEKPESECFYRQIPCNDTIQ